MNRINVGRNGVFGGLFGNPKREKKVTEQYRTHFQKVMRENIGYTRWLKRQIDNGAELYCPGCGVGSPTCHARIIEQELAK